MIYLPCVVKDKSEKYIVRSIRVPGKIWSLLKRISSSGYRPLNSQIIKMFEDWLVDHSYIENKDRTTFED